MRFAALALLQTTRLTLRPSMPADAADFRALERDPEVMRYLNGGHPVDQEEADPDAPFLMPRGTEPHVWTARLAAGEAFVGWFCLWPEDDGLAELGYRLARAFWGRGLASEGAAALIAWGFTAAGYGRIVSTTMVVNQGSRRVMEKIGMTHTRTVPFTSGDPIPGSEQGDVWYELTRAAWQAGRGH
ncbi:RimJ/RimL family protein N-acetyltransferase [Dongia mobilis]|uniref:RimJ/RimL family protein N-acetyltransferase n=2 Tax=Dongia mobilis TaxID=578943 RepID=A0A4R6WSJ7_9PROT|nr:RimJ/RimL family protein N-acetyltransferase [Dongia mobilis]